MEEHRSCRIGEKGKRITRNKREEGTTTGPAVLECETIERVRKAQLKLRILDSISASCQLTRNHALCALYRGERVHKECSTHIIPI